MSGTWTAPKTWVAAILTVSDMNQYLRDNQSYLKTHIALEAAGALTVAAGVITITQGYHKVAGQGAANDDLDTISGGSEGMVIILRANGQVITLKDGVDNLDLGNDIVITDDDHIALICDDADDWHPLWQSITRTFLVNAFQYPNSGTDWTPQLEGAHLAASLGAKKVWLPFNFLKQGDEIISYKLLGDGVETNVFTLDCKLVRINLADPLTTTDIAGGAIAQVNVDGDFDVEATLTNPEVVTTDKQYVAELLGTTGVGDAITVIGAEFTIRRLI